MSKAPEHVITADTGPDEPIGTMHLGVLRREFGAHDLRFESDGSVTFVQIWKCRIWDQSLWIPTEGWKEEAEEFVSSIKTVDGKAVNGSWIVGYHDGTIFSPRSTYLHLSIDDVKPPEQVLSLQLQDNVVTNVDRHWGAWIESDDQDSINDIKGTVYKSRLYDMSIYPWEPNWHLEMERFLWSINAIDGNKVIAHEYFGYNDRTAYGHILIANEHTEGDDALTTDASVSTTSIVSGLGTINLPEFSLTSLTILGSLGFLYLFLNEKQENISNKKLYLFGAGSLGIYEIYNQINN